MTAFKQQVLMGQTDESLAQTTAVKLELQGQPWRESCGVLLKEDREVAETNATYTRQGQPRVCAVLLRT